MNNNRELCELDPDNLNSAIAHLNKDIDGLKTDLIKYKLLSNCCQKCRNVFTELKDSFPPNEETLDLINEFKLINSLNQKTCFVSINKLDENYSNETNGQPIDERVDQNIGENVGNTRSNEQNVSSDEISEQKPVKTELKVEAIKTEEEGVPEENRLLILNENISLTADRLSNGFKKEPISALQEDSYVKENTVSDERPEEPPNKQIIPNEIQNEDHIQEVSNELQQRIENIRSLISDSISGDHHKTNIECVDITEDGSDLEQMSDDSGEESKESESDSDWKMSGTSGQNIGNKRLLISYPSALISNDIRIEPNLQIICDPHTSGALKCDQKGCSKSFTSNVYLNYHKKFFHSSKYLCKVKGCVFRTWNQSFLDRHQQTVHLETSRNGSKQRESDNQIIVCEIQNENKAKEVSNETQTRIEDNPILRSHLINDEIEKSGIECIDITGDDSDSDRKMSDNSDEELNGSQIQRETDNQLKSQTSDTSDQNINQLIDITDEPNLPIVYIPECDNQLETQIPVVQQNSQICGTSDQKTDNIYVIVFFEPNLQTVSNDEMEVPETDKQFATQMSDVFVCDRLGCSQSFDSQWYLDYHKNFFHLREYLCDVEGCLFRTGTELDLDRHLRTSHRNTPSILKSNKNREIPQTQQTTDVLQNSQLLSTSNPYTDHSFTSGVFKCEWKGCSKTVSSQHCLSLHRTSHLRQFHCRSKGCEFKGPTLSLLVRHREEVHSNEGLVRCVRPDCMNVFTTRDLLLKHERSAHTTVPVFPTDFNDHNYIAKSVPSDVFTCDWKGCAKTFISQHRLNSHKGTHSERLLCRLNGCEFKARTLSQLVDHRQAVHSSEGLFICVRPNCMKIFVTSEMLIKHERNVHNAVPTNDALFECVVKNCNIRFQSKEDMRTHMRTDHKFSEGLVNIYFKAYETLGSVKKLMNPKPHKKLHSNSTQRITDSRNEPEVIQLDQLCDDPKNQIFVCPLENCNNLFKKRHLLREHQMTAHQMIEVSEGMAKKTNIKQMSPKKSFKGKYYVCRQNGCGNKRFKTIKGLRAHMGRHSGVKYKCFYLDCTDVFLSRSAFRSHLNKHKDDYRCDWEGCRFRGRYQADLNKHKNIHLESNRSICFPCNKKFFKRELLRAHRRTIHQMSDSELEEGVGQQITEFVRLSPRGKRFKLEISSPKKRVNSEVRVKEEEAVKCEPWFKSEEGVEREEGVKCEERVEEDIKLLIDVLITKTENSLLFN